ncbi:MAG: adenosylcobalamin-dependent ribonucleoside-diphosphate reductase [Anaerolineales bacterium]|nr:adenosylcobalamin-dependent ribonucleoside-diphosphate reductase [Anaerolineales bacterium]
MLDAKQSKLNGSHPAGASNGHKHGKLNGNGNGRGPREVTLTDNARVVLEKRYLRRGANGKPEETIPEMFWRVAHHVALAEREFGGSETDVEEQFYDLLTSLRFFPNSPTFTGAGTPLGQLAACFVLKIEDDMGRSEAGIFQALRDAALIQQTGGGNGFSFSRLRPKAALVTTSSGEATGPVGFLRVYDKAFGEIAQGGTRRGANMAVLRCDHPDIEEFITCKTDENAITNFNISVGITDAFMRAVQADADWDLRFPDVRSPEYRHFHGTLEQAERAGLTLVTYKTVRARALFDKIVAQAHHNGEPGVLFLDAANRENPVPHLYELEATNPCGEQFLGPFENCCLGSINLAQHAGPNGTVDWDKLRESTVLSTRFLDDVVTANAYVPAVPQLKKAAMAARRIGLGIMGLGDLMYHAGIRYGSPEAQAFAAQVMEFVRYHCMLTSVDLARQRGTFEAFAGSLYDPAGPRWAPPAPPMAYPDTYGRPAVDWQQVVDGIQAHGIRNACQTTVAPTGTIATVAGCESYGCEPVFALAYIRHVNDRGHDLQLTYTSPLFERALTAAGVDEAARARIVEQVLVKGSCQDIAEVPESVRHTFVVSADITADEHVRMQAAIQRFVDNSLSKTCNFSEDATEADVAQAYLLAWEQGCKGLTVYVTGSRDKVVLETHATANAKAAPAAAPAPVAAPAPQPVPMFHENKKPRPSRLRGSTMVVGTPVGKSFVTVNENGSNQPFEVFITTAKAGSETAAISEAIGRLISYILRLASPVAPRDRLQEVIRQLSGIGTGRSIGFGPNRVASFPDGVARALAEYASEEPSEPASSAPEAPASLPLPLAQSSWAAQPAPAAPLPGGFKIGDICPECGEASLVNEEGCRKCYSCGFSQC